ncbi:hypothetical protein [Acidovorax sp. LjRoot117]|uniref:hypothetical protein n=1 Tax=Acidovorax sp. LjRoot117 TaxID=3342255 RepID=UPI003ECDA61C
MTSPTWQELRDAGRVLIDQPDRGLAIYPTTLGKIVIVVRAVGGDVHVVPVQLPEVDAVAHAIAECESRATAAQEILHEKASAIEAYHLIQRAMGAV